MIIPLIAAVLLVAVDQITKYIALTQLKPIGSVTFIDGFMDFTFVETEAPHSAYSAEKLGCCLLFP